MPSMPIHKYRAFEAVPLADRRWPARVIERSPQWCSVDLRDGNQALVEPMGVERKRRMFLLLVGLGFKEIEVGFPSASQPDFDFVRELIDEDLIPSDVTIQVLTQARSELIDRTFEAIVGARRAIVHVYNSTSTLQRRVVFGLDENGVVEIATSAVRRIKALANGMPQTEVVLEYSPESFTGTELPFARRIVEAVLAEWGATPEDKVIVNLPATVEMSTPNVFADQIEWFDRNCAGRDTFVLSVHPHNDRGTAVAAAELALLAGADRIEGTLFGNGERTGNVDIVTLALNLFSQGIEPKLDFTNVPHVVETVEHCNRMPVHARHPYGGELVFTAFSGSHQDAIKKGFAAREVRGDVVWEVPYLPVDPYDLGRDYEAVVRINSQSGKGGVAYVLESDYGYALPKALQVEFGKTVQSLSESCGGEVTSLQIVSAFEGDYFAVSPLRLIEAHVVDDGTSRVKLEATLTGSGGPRTIHGSGNGPIDALVAALRRDLGIGLHVRNYHEHAIGSGEDAAAVAYVEAIVADHKYFGVGRDPNITKASLHAVVAAVNRAIVFDNVRCNGLSAPERMEERAPVALR